MPELLLLLSGAEEGSPGPFAAWYGAAGAQEAESIVQPVEQCDPGRAVGHWQEMG